MTRTPAPRAPRSARAVLVHQLRTVAADLPLMITAPLYRRRHLRWGATPGEVLSRMPGDDLLPHAQFRCTRAVTIDAPPVAVWPWLVQVGCRSRRLVQQRPARQPRPSQRPRDPPRAATPRGRAVGADGAHATVADDRVAGRRLRGDRWLLWRKPDSTWSWTLTELDDGTTRLVTRVHAVYDWTRPATALLGVVLMEFGDFAMMRRMLLGIKERAESLRGSPPV